jgi:hypothetical protein
MIHHVLLFFIIPTRILPYNPNGATQKTPSSCLPLLGLRGGRSSTLRALGLEEGRYDPHYVFPSPFSPENGEGYREGLPSNLPFLLPVFVIPFHHSSFILSSHPSSPNPLIGT